MADNEIKDPFADAPLVDPFADKPINQVEDPFAEEDERPTERDIEAQEPEKESPQTEEFSMPGPYGDMISEGINLSPEEQKEQVKDLGALPLGVAQGVTLEYADEIAGELFGEEAKEAIREYQNDPNRQGLGLLGNVIGGIALGGPLAKAGTKIGQLAGLGSKLDKVSKAKKYGALGAAEGAVTGLGATDKSIEEDPIGAIEETILTALLGGAIGAGVGKLAAPSQVKSGPEISKDLDKVKSLDEAVEVIGKDKVDNILTRAEARANRDYQKNLESVNAIKKMNENPELNNLLDTSADPKSKVETFVENFDWEKYVPQGDKAEIELADRRLNRLLKLDFGEEIAEEKIKHIRAYSNYRDEMLGYLRWLTNNNKGKMSSEQMYNELKKGVDKPFSAKLKEELPQLVESGQVNPDSFTLYKLQQNIADEFYNESREQLTRRMLTKSEDGYENGLPEEIKDQIEEDIKKDMMLKDPVGTLGRKLMNVNTVAEIADSRAGTDTQEIIYDIIQARNLKTSWENNLKSLHHKVMKVRSKYPDLKGEDIVDLIESGKKHPVADAYRTMFKKIRNEANKKGVNIQEYNLGQDKYVRMKRKTGADLISSFRARFNELGGLEDANPEMLNPILEKAYTLDKYKQLLASPDTDVKQAIRIKSTISSLEKELKESIGQNPKIKDIIEFKDALSNHYSGGKDLNTVENIKKAMSDEEILSPRSISNSTDGSIAALYMRGDAELPSWLREKNIDSLVQQNIADVSSNIFYKDQLNKLDTRVVYFDTMGMDGMADYFRKYRNDLMGRSRNIELSKPLEAIKDWNARRQITWREKPALKLALGLENYALSALYPNYLGANIASVTRNMMQVPTMTLPEMGYEHTGKVMKNLLGTVVNFTANRKQFREDVKRLAKKGIIVNRDLKPEDMEGIKRGLKEYFKDSPMAARMDKFIDKYNETVMWAFSVSDTINRVATAKATEELVSKAFKGDKASLNTIKNLSGPVQVQMKKVMDAGLGEEAISEVLMKHFDTQTQLAYGDVDMFELGRDLGPVMTMLTKWPTSIGGDIAKKVMLDGNKKGTEKVVMKYFVPVALLSMVDRGLQDQTDESWHKAVIGPRGFSGGAPLGSVLAEDVRDLIMPAPSLMSTNDLIVNGVQWGSQALSGSPDAKRSKKATQKALKQWLQQHTPVLGSMSVAKDRIEKITKD